MNVPNPAAAVARRYRRSLRAQLQSALVLMLVPLVVVGGTGWGLLEHSAEKFMATSSQVAAESKVIDGLRGRMGQTHQLAQAYATRRDEKARAEFRRLAREIDARFALLARLYAKHDAEIGPGRGRWEQAQTQAERAFAMKLLPADDPDVEYPLFPFHKLADAASTELGEEQVRGFERLEAAAADAESHEHAELLLMLAVFLLGLAAALILARRLGRAIIAPLRRLEDAADRLGEDDLTARVAVERQDELGRVAGTFNHMADRLVESREAREQLEEQLRQAQKLEAVGRLAGGIAHDFNNLLMVVKGHCELLLRRLGPDGPGSTSRELDEIASAADRAVSLTGQLLAFSRRQVLQTEVLEPNELVGGMSTMLGRLIGEDVELKTVLAEGIGSVEADRGQLEQILMNLALNARDAMPHGGRLTIETANVTLDEHYAGTHAEVVPGEYVMLAVSDNGHGMDAATQARIFEPFFTTKEVGKGTGLGLATVYGIVKQSGGSIAAYSEPGHGTTFKVYLPRTDEVPAPATAPADAGERGGTETILLVEDEAIVGELVTEMLEEHGYRVLAASNGEEALALAQSHPGIDLLITDVVMPGMTGPELARRLAPSIADLKVIFTSGYTDEAIVHQGVLDHSVAFLQKPFTMADLDRKVRDVISEAA